MRFFSETNKLSRHGSRAASINGTVVVVIVLFSISVGGFFVGGFLREENAIAVKQHDSQASSQPTSQNRPTGKLYPISVRKPDGPPRVFTGINDIHGKPLTVACATCHATRQPNFENKVPADLDEFHSSLSFAAGFAHGTVSCLSCHNSEDYDALKLADGSRVEFTEVMTLCAQCHGPQMRDYEHGAHGGMNGYWDLSRGPRTKNNCVDCHHPHSPKFPKMQPTFKPRDRFLSEQP